LNLVQDSSVNITSYVEAALAKAFAQKVDAAGIVGDGTGQPVGVANTPGVGETLTVGEPTLLSLLPMCATFPLDRLLLLPGVGAMAAIAVLLRTAWRERQRLTHALGGGALVLLHLVASAVLLPLRSASVGDFDQLLRVSERSLPSGPSVQDLTLVLLNPALDPLAAYLPIYRVATGRPRPARQLWLASGITDVDVRTLDLHRLLICPKAGFLAFASERMLRRPGSGLSLGERVSLPGAEVVVNEHTEDGRPRCVMVRFDLPLSDPRLVFFRWRGDGYAQVRLPVVPIGRADHIHDDLHAAVIGEDALGEILRFVVDGHICARLTADVMFARAGGDDDRRADDRCDLRRR
jgi:hypothetical protein